MEALGRLINPQYLMDALYVSMKDCAGVAFLCYKAGGDTYTLTEAKDAAATGAQVLATITRYWTCTGDGSDTWTLNTQAAASTVVTGAGATANCCLVEVQGIELSDTYDYINVASTGAGVVVAIPYGLTVARKPSNLAAIGA